MKNNLLPIAKEGWGYITYTFLFLVFSIIFSLEIFTFLSLCLLIFLGYTFRNPERELLMTGDKSVLSPVDGNVISIEELDDSEYFYKLTIQSTLKDVSLLRTPINAITVSQNKYNGTCLRLGNPLAKKLNERATLVFEDTYANKVKIVHITAESFCGIETDNLKHNEQRQSSRYGVMVNGVSEVYLPKNFRLNISVADELKASQHLLGYFS